mgnify:CR=1 FL=1
MSGPCLTPNQSGHTVNSNARSTTYAGNATDSAAASLASKNSRPRERSPRALNAIRHVGHRCRVLGNVSQWRADLHRNSPPCFSDRAGRMLGSSDLHGGLARCVLVASRMRLGDERSLGQPANRPTEACQDLEIEEREKRMKPSKKCQTFFRVSFHLWFG